MLARFCESTSCCGVIDLYHARHSKCQFVFWTIVLVSMSCFTAFFTFRTVETFINNPTVTNVEMVRPAYMDMPELLLCYNGGFDVTALRNAGFEEGFIKNFQAAMNYVNYASGNKTQYQQMLNRYMKKENINLMQFVERFGFKCPDILVSYSKPPFDSSTCDNSYKVTSDRGLCFGFKNEGAKQLWPGIWGGLDLTVKQPHGSFADVYKNETYQHATNVDFSIALERKLGTFPSKRDFLIPINRKVEMSLNTKVYRRLGNSNPCANEESLYTANTCFFDCYTAEVKKTYNCTPITRVPYADDATLKHVCDTFLNTGFVDMNNVQSCNANCLPKCEEWIFEATTTHSQLHGTFDDALGRSHVMIGYNTMQYTKIEEVDAFTLDMAISNVGGQAGLWLGISIVTVIQAAYYAVLGSFSRFTEQYSFNNNK